MAEQLKCLICQHNFSTFKNPSTLLAHIRNCHQSPPTTENLYPSLDIQRCSACNLTFLKSSGLSSHRKSCHISSNTPRNPPTSSSPPPNHSTYSSDMSVSSPSTSSSSSNLESPISQPFPLVRRSNRIQNQLISQSQSSNTSTTSFPSTSTNMTSGNSVPQPVTQAELPSPSLPPSATPSDPVHPTPPLIQSQPNPPIFPPNLTLRPCSSVYSIPKPLQQPFLTLFKRLLHSVVRILRRENHHQSLRASIALLTLPSFIEKARGRKAIANSCRLINKLLSPMYEEDIVHGILIEASQSLPITAPTNPLNPTNMSESTDVPTIPSSTLNKISKYVRSGLPVKAMRLVENSLESKLVNVTPEVIEELRTLHPPDAFGGLSAQPPPIPPEEIPAISISEIMDTLKGCPKLSAASISGWSFDLLQSLLNITNGEDIRGNDSLIHLIAELLTMLARGKIPCPTIWLSSKLIPIRKSNNKLRPIAIPDMWVRLVGRIILKRHLPALQNYFQPTQLGIGLKGGTEIMNHTTQILIHHMRTTRADGNLVLQSVDFSNAFNTIGRSAIEDQVRNVCPQLLPFFKWAYGSPTPLFSVNGGSLKKICDSTSGVRQGDPLGPALFDLALHPCLLQIKQRLPNITIMAYHDDVLLYGQHDQVSDAFRLLETLSRRVGLIVNKEKSKKLCYEDVISNQSTMTSLSIPLGSSPAVSSAMNEKLAAIQQVLNIFPQLDPHSQLQLLRSCVNTKATYYARCLDITNTTDFFANFDKSIDTALLRLCDSPLNVLPTHSRYIRHLPLRHGGLGIPSLQNLRAVAWNASYLACAPHIDRICGPYTNIWKDLKLFALRYSNHLLVTNMTLNTAEDLPQAFHQYERSTHFAGLMRSIRQPETIERIDDIMVDYGDAGEDEVQDMEIAALELSPANVDPIVDQEDPIELHEADAHTNLYSQKNLAEKLHMHMKNILIQYFDHHSPTLHGPWIRSLTTTGNSSTKWTALPSLVAAHAGLASAAVYSQALSFVLLLPTCGSQDAHCVCGRAFTTDEMPVHAVSCATFRGCVNRRHTAVKEVIFKHLQKWKVPGADIRKEHPMRQRDGNKAMDIAIFYQQTVRLLDVSIVCCRSIRTADGSYASCGAQVAEREKRSEIRRCLEFLNINESCFYPFVLEVTGRVGPAADSVKRKFLKMLEDKGLTKEQQLQKLSNLYSAIQATIWFWNATVYRSLRRFGGLIRDPIEERNQDDDQ